MSEQDEASSMIAAGGSGNYEVKVRRHRLLVLKLATLSEARCSSDPDVLRQLLGQVSTCSNSSGKTGRLLWRRKSSIARSPSAKESFGKISSFTQACYCVDFSNAWNSGCVSRP